MAATLDVFSGNYPGDPFTIVQPRGTYLDELNTVTRPLRIGVALTKWGEAELESDVLAAVIETAKVLEQMGHAIEEIKPPFATDDFVEIISGLSNIRAGGLQKAASAIGREINSDTLEPMNLRIFRSAHGVPLTIAMETIDRIRKMRASVGDATSELDIILTPTLAGKALPHGSVSTTNDSYTVKGWMEAEASTYQYLGVFSVTGQPSVSLPLAYSDDGLPIGVQIVGRFSEEATLVQLARDLEEAMPWAGRRPPVHVATAS